MEPVLHKMVAPAADAMVPVKSSPRIANQRICEINEARNFRQRPGENWGYILAKEGATPAHMDRRHFGSSAGTSLCVIPLQVTLSAYSIHQSGWRRF